MAFVESARQRVSELRDAEDAGLIRERKILEVMLEHCVGRENAKNWGELETLFEQRGIHVSRNAFQQQHTDRQGDIFIGSNDRGEVSGYFLIQDLQDALIMRNWYENRMAATQANMDNLERLIDEAFGAD
mgnify:CR=1 FL=1